MKGLAWFIAVAEIFASVTAGGSALGGNTDFSAPGAGPNDINPTNRASEPADTSAPAKPFRIILTAPLLATSNAVGSAAADVASRSAKPDVHINPDLLATWTRQFAAVKLSASIDVSADRFAINTDQNTDSVYGRFKASLTDGRAELFVPYLAVASTLDYLPFFAIRDDALLDFGVGFTSGFGVSARGDLIPRRDAVEPGDIQVVFDVGVGRRLADPPIFRNVFLTAKLDLSDAVSRSLLLGITPSIRLQHYDSYNGFPRRDARFGWTAYVQWTPEWLTRRVRAAEIDFTLTYLRNSSNLPSTNYTIWEGGPAVVLSWRF